MQITKQFALDSTALEEHMNQLIEVLAALLEEPQTVLAPRVGQQRVEAALADLRSSDGRVTHVLKVPELQLWQ
jgi:hypothetical protein